MTMVCLNVTSIGLAQNQLTELPAEIGNLTDVTDINLKRNLLRGDITALAPLVNVELFQIGDGADGNDCLTTTSVEFAARLDELDPSWDLCENP